MRYKVQVFTCIQDEEGNVSMGLMIYALMYPWLS